VRNQLFDLAHRHLEAAGISRRLDGVIEPASRARTLLDEVKIFRSLSDDERDQLAQSMSAQQYAAGQVVLGLEEVPDSLMVIATGVVSATVPDGAGHTEAGRMGPSEVMGEQSILGDTPSEATFTTLTSCIIYRIDKALVRSYMEQRGEVGRALNKLQAVRTQNSRLALMTKPAPIKKGGFLSWMQKR
jgi:CRP-like cAMP-binding protein